MSIVSSLIYAFFAAYRIDVDGTKSKFSDENIRTFDLMQIVIEAFFFIGMVVSALIEYNCEDGIHQIWVKDVSKTTANYIKHGSF